MSKLSNPEIHDINQQVQSLKSQLILEGQKLPSQKLFDVSLLQVDINTLEAKLAAHESATQQEKDTKAKALADSLQVLEDVKAILYSAGEKIDKHWSKLDHSHRRLAGDFKKMIAQNLRGYKPTKKGK